MPPRTNLGTIGSIGRFTRIAPLGGNTIPVPVVTPPPILVEGRPNLDFRRPTARPRGPELIGIGVRRGARGGPWPAPAGFKTPSTSFLEWVWYWASFVALGLKGDPRMPPFTGDPGGLFEYQVADDPLNPRQAASGVSDFIYNLGTGLIVVRIDTYYYHVATSPAQQGRDRYLKSHSAIATSFTVSAWDYTILGDETGGAAVRAVARALKRQEPINPVDSGLAYPVRDMITRQVPA